MKTRYSIPIICIVLFIASSFIVIVYTEPESFGLTRPYSSVGEYDGAVSERVLMIHEQCLDQKQNPFKDYAFAKTSNGHYYIDNVICERINVQQGRCLEPFNKGYPDETCKNRVTFDFPYGETGPEISKEFCNKVKSELRILNDTKQNDSMYPEYFHICTTRGLIDDDESNCENCELHGCAENEIYDHDICMTQEFKERAESIGEIEGNCGKKYMVVGNDECVLNPEFIEPFTTIIYDVTDNSGTRLSIAPHSMIIDLKDGDTVMFVNDGLTTVNIFDNSKGFWRFDNVKPSSQRELVINGTGFYEFLVQNSREGESGEIVALSEDTNSLPVEIRSKMAQTIVGSDFRKGVGLIGVGSGGAEPGITIDIDEKFRDKYDDAEKFYYEKYRMMIPFDVPIWIEFTTPSTFATG